MTDRCWGNYECPEGCGPDECKNEPSVQPAGSSDDTVQLGMLRDDVSRLRDLVIDLRYTLSEIYALRGEDEEVARLCREAIEEADRRA